ncbi:MAG: glycosyltransferase family 2 protein [Lachnospiraceae bacterium]|nr:glycosyltransferase family 2 protein [Lachnospiraceae bacterium]
MDKLYMVIPAYNEEANIGTVVGEWYAVLEKLIAEGADPESRLVVINDGSKDGTYEIMEGLKAGRPGYLPLTKANSGHGATVLFGYKYAIEAEADYIFQTDSDGQTVPEEFYEFWKLREAYDMVIGNRTQRQDGGSRILVTKTLKTVIRMFFHVNTVDANTPFRLIRRETLQKYMHLIPEDFNLSNVLVAVIFEKKKASVKYLPITFRQRQGGKNSINIKSITKIGWKAIRDFVELNRQL